MFIPGEECEPAMHGASVTCDTKQEGQYPLALQRRWKTKNVHKRCLEDGRSGEGLRKEALGPRSGAGAET